MHASTGKIVPITDRRIYNFLIKTPPGDEEIPCFFLLKFASLSCTIVPRYDLRHYHSHDELLLHIYLSPALGGLSSIQFAENFADTRTRFHFIIQRYITVLPSKLFFLEIVTQAAIHVQTMQVHEMTLKQYVA